MAAGLVWLGHASVMTQVILPPAMPHCASFLDRRRTPWRVVLLMPCREVLMTRSRTRRNWPHPTPPYWVHHFYDALLAAPADAQVNVHDNTDESPEQIAQALWRMMPPAR